MTDSYLLALAASHHGRLVTLDRTVDRSSVSRAGQDALVVLE